VQTMRAFVCATATTSLAVALAIPLSLLTKLSDTARTAYFSIERLRPRRRSVDQRQSAPIRIYRELNWIRLQASSNSAPWKANSAAAYFRAWREIPLKWQNSARHPIPDDWKFIGSRTSRFNLAGNRNASHPVNAILNYAYAIL